MMVAETIPPPWFVAPAALGIGGFLLLLSALGLAMCLISRTSVRGPLFRDRTLNPSLLAVRALARLAIPAGCLLVVGAETLVAGFLWSLVGLPEYHV